VRVVSGVFIDRQDLERELEPAQILGGTLDGHADGFLVVPERQDDRHVVARTIGHCPGT